MASKEQEVEWIEQPGGWDGDETQGGKEVDNGKDDNDDDYDDDSDQNYGGFDLFAGQESSESTFPFDVITPSGNAVHLRLEGFALGSDETAQSTGVTLWQAAPRLAQYLAEEIVTEELVRGKSVLELGAGLGLCGMVAHHLGAKRVVLTDADTITLERMRGNLEKNCSKSVAASSKDGSPISCQQLIWNNVSQMEACGKFDTVLGADVIYTVESLEPLFDTVSFFLAHKTEDDLESENCGEGRRAFVLSRYTKYGNISDETVLDAARARNLVWTRPSEGVFVFRRGQFADSHKNEEPYKTATSTT